MDGIRKEGMNGTRKNGFFCNIILLRSARTRTRSRTRAGSDSKTQTPHNDVWRNLFSLKKFELHVVPLDMCLQMSRSESQCHVKACL